MLKHTLIDFINSLLAIAALGLCGGLLFALGLIGLAIAQWATQKNPSAETSAGGRAQGGGRGASNAQQSGDASNIKRPLGEAK